MNRQKHIWVFIFVVLFAFASQAQVTFQTKVSRKKLGINERVRVDFVMNADGDDFNPPSFEGFRVVGGPNQSISNSYINRKRTYSKTYSYFLSPLKQGTLRIGAASITVSGTTYTTGDVTLQITSAVQTPSDGTGTNPEVIASQNVHLVAEISNTTPYLNERTTIVYKLYVSNNVSITSQWREINSPRYADFWSKNIDTQKLNLFEGKYQGEDYRYVILKTTVLYPQKTGPLKIEPLTLDVPIDVPGKRRNIFGRTLTTRVNKTISAGESTIVVKPLPLEGRPENFTGAVGDFTFSVKPSKKVLEVDQALTFDLLVSGKGNLNTLSMPDLKLPNTLEVYEPQRKENIRTRPSGISGTISQRYTVVPQNKGKYPISPVSFSFFNPESQSYKEVFSEQIVLRVTAGSSPKQDPALAKNQTPKTQPITLQQRFRYIKLNTDLKPSAASPFFKSRVFWALFLSPLCLLPLIILIGRKQRSLRGDVQGLKLRKANKMARKYLAEARKNKHNKAIFYEALERSLHNYLKARLDIQSAEMSKERITMLLIGRKVEADTVLDFEKLLKSCELARYTPTSDVAIEKDYKKAIDTISLIDKQIR